MREVIISDSVFTISLPKAADFEELTSRALHMCTSVVMYKCILQVCLCIECIHGCTVQFILLVLYVNSLQVLGPLKVHTMTNMRMNTPFHAMFMKVKVFP